MGVHSIQQEHKREGGHFCPREPGVQSSAEDMMLELSIGLYRGFPGRLEEQVVTGTCA